jgi:hypothetical protein
VRESSSTIANVGPALAEADGALALAEAEVTTELDALGAADAAEAEVCAGAPFDPASR